MAKSLRFRIYSFLNQVQSLLDRLGRVHYYLLPLLAAIFVLSRITQHYNISSGTEWIDNTIQVLDIPSLILGCIIGFYLLTRLFAFHFLDPNAYGATVTR